MTRLWLLLLFSLLTLNLHGQKLKGSIVDSEDKSAIVSANIIVLDLDSTFHKGQKSDSKGKFELAIQLNSFNVNISYLGYLGYDIAIQRDGNGDINLGQIELVRDTKQIADIVVTAAPVTIVLNKTMAYPTSMQVKASSSGIELLKNLNFPGLFVDPISQRIQASGASGIIYKINGRTVAQHDILTLKPESVLRIEYEDIPSVRYANVNAATINVVLKKRETGTFLFTDFMSAVSTGFINSNSSAKTVFGKSELEINYAINWRDYDKRWASEQETYRLPDETYTWDKKYNNAPMGYADQNINIGYTFNDNKNIFSAKLYNHLFNNYQYSDIDITRLESDIGNISRDIYLKNKSYSPSLDLFYSRKLRDESGLEFNLVATYMTSDYLRNLTDTYINQDNKESYIQNSVDGNKKSMIFEGLYFNNNSKKVGYSVGVRGNYSYTKNRYEERGISRLKQLEIYPYAEISGRITSSIGYSVGTGIKIYNMDNYDQSKKYYRNLTTLTLQYAKGNIWSLKYNFSYTPSYPTLSDISDIYQRQDFLTVVRGNPAIKPSQGIYNRLSFTYTHKKIQVYAGIYASKTFDAINDAIIYDESLESIVIQKVNQSYINAIGSSLEIAIPSIFKMFSLQVGAYLDRYQSKGEGYKYSYTDFSWLVMLNWQYKKFTMSGGYAKPKTTLYGIYKQQHENYSAISFSYKLDNLTLKGGVYFPFTSGTKYGLERKSDIAPSHVRRYIRDNRNMIYLGATYYISWGKSPFKVGKKLQNKDKDSGILKPTDI